MKDEASHKHHELEPIGAPSLRRLNFGIELHRQIFPDNPICACKKRENGRQKCALIIGKDGRPVGAIDRKVDILSRRERLL